jgi:hypothetical protein
VAWAYVSEFFALTDIIFGEGNLSSAHREAWPRYKQCFYFPSFFGSIATGVDRPVVAKIAHNPGYSAVPFMRLA